mmetsp:Transcript_85351/g.265306  ORF Transcript_85351/g.265306 Transcript_85351/m.265306 type:complete len:279 (+) Transcript_85351:93-929(+)
MQPYRYSPKPPGAVWPIAEELVIWQNSRKRSAASPPHLSGLKIGTSMRGRSAADRCPPEPRRWPACCRKPPPGVDCERARALDPGRERARDPGREPACEGSRTALIPSPPRGPSSPAASSARASSPVVRSERRKSPRLRMQRLKFQVTVFLNLTASLASLRSGVVSRPADVGLTGGTGNSRDLLAPRPCAIVARCVERRHVLGSWPAAHIGSSCFPSPGREPKADRGLALSSQWSRTVPGRRSSMISGCLSRATSSSGRLTTPPSIRLFRCKYQCARS